MQKTKFFLAASFRPKERLTPFLQKAFNFMDAVNGHLIPTQMLYNSVSCLPQ